MNFERRSNGTYVFDIVYNVPERFRDRVDGKKQLRRTIDTAELLPEERPRGVSDLKLLRAQKLKELRDQVSKTRSLTEQEQGTFAQLLKYRIKTAGDASMPEMFKRVLEDFGATPMELFVPKYLEYINLLETTKSRTTKRLRALATVNRYKSVIKMILMTALEDGLIDRMPLRIRIPLRKEVERDRVFVGDERDRLEKVMIDHASHLYWFVYFAERNPGRKQDLLHLPRTRLDMSKPWVRYTPMKTGNEIPKPTTLIEIDEDLIRYAQALPPDCPLLFPRLIWSNEDQEHIRNYGWNPRNWDMIRRASWEPMGDPKRHWNTLLRNADPAIADFKIHDLKHVALTSMLNAGYTPQQIKSLGIQYTERTLWRYYHRDAELVLDQRKERLLSLAS